MNLRSELCFANILPPPPPPLTTIQQRHNHADRFRPMTSFFISTNRQEKAVGSMKEGRGSAPSAYSCNGTAHKSQTMCAQIYIHTRSRTFAASGAPCCWCVGDAGQKTRRRQCRNAEVETTLSRNHGLEFALICGSPRATPGTQGSGYVSNRP